MYYGILQACAKDFPEEVISKEIRGSELRQTHCSLQEHTEGMGVKQRASWMKHMEKLGRQRATTMRLVFNQDFQKYHKFGLAKNHWSHFLIYLALGEVPHAKCEACQNTLSVACMTVEEVVEQVPDPGFGKRRRVTQPAEGVALGRPKGKKEFNIWKWLEEQRSGMYEWKEGEESVKCTLCKSVVQLVRLSTDHFVRQHENGKKHKDALSLVNSDGKPEGLPCEGILLEPPCDLEPVRGYEGAFMIWAKAGFPWINHGKAAGGSHACGRAEDGSVFVRALACSQQHHNCQPEKKFCIHCERLAVHEKFLERVCRWAFRISLCDLLQATMTHSQEKREQILETFDSAFFLQPTQTGWDDTADLRRQDYPTLYELCRQKLGCLPRNVCNNAAKLLVESRFAWLSSKVLVVDGPHAAALKAYQAALSKGSLPSEVKLAEHVLAGTLRTDSVLKTLVTACIQKCQNVADGRTRIGATKLPGVDETELAECGFTLAACA